MKNMINKIRKKFLIILAYIIGFVASFTIAYAVNNYFCASSESSYSNTTTGMSATDVQAAIDELYNHCLSVHGTEWNFSYIGARESFVAPYNGNYKLEVWGAEGGSSNYNTGGSTGKGGYKYGTVYLNKGDVLYVTVGGKGTNAGDAGSAATGGYNGGADGQSCDNNNGCTKIGGGGGATHIGTFNATLSNHNSDEGLYIIAGGGGGLIARRTWNDQGQFTGSDTSGGAGGSAATSTTKWVGAGTGAGGGYYGGSSNNGGSSWTASNLTNVGGTAGAQTGNGKAKISFLG